MPADQLEARSGDGFFHLGDLTLRCRTPTDSWTARIAAAYEVIASKLSSEGFTRRRRAAGDIFRRRQDVLRIQLTRKLGTTAWRLREVGPMRQIAWHELREAGRALSGGELAQLF